MNNIEMYGKILGINKPWTVSDVKLDMKAKKVTIRIECEKNVRHECPECNTESPGYDKYFRSWRHLDTCQMTTIIECEVPRVKCKNHGIKQIQVPWAEANSHFTAMFEILAINWLKESSISGVARLLGLSWDQVAGIQARAVKRGLKRRKRKVMKNLAIDETSFQKHHEYVTIIYDKDQKTVIDVLDDRKAETLEKWLKSEKKSRRKAIKTISMDMWDPFILAVKNAIPGYENKICFDHFHVSQHFGKAVDRTRSQEHKTFINEKKDSPLSKTKHDWLRNAELIDNRSRKDFMKLARSNLKTARAWAIKETASKLWNFTYRKSAIKAWNQLLSWIRRCRLKEVIKVGNMIKNYLWGIINAIVNRATNAVAEAKNARIQWIKKKSCGFRNRERFKMSILFHLGGLDLMPNLQKKPC